MLARPRETFRNQTLLSLANQSPNQGFFSELDLAAAGQLRRLGLQESPKIQSIRALPSDYERLLPSHQGSEVSNVVSGGPGHEQAAEPFEKVVRVGTLLEAGGVHSKISRALDASAVSYGAGGG